MKARVRRGGKGSGRTGGSIPPTGSTELERARAHLQLCQRNLDQQRKHGLHELDYLDEDRVLAALSWVWDAQEREMVRIAQECVFVRASDFIDMKAETTAAEFFAGQERDYTKVLFLASPLKSGDRARLVRDADKPVSDIASRIGQCGSILEGPTAEGLYVFRFDDGWKYWASVDMLERVGSNQ